MRYTHSQGQHVTVAQAPGLATGDLFAMMLSVLGLGALFLTPALTFSVSKWVGAAYLVYLGLKMLPRVRTLRSRQT